MAANNRRNNNANNQQRSDQPAGNQASESTQQNDQVPDSQQQNEQPGGAPPMGLDDEPDASGASGGPPMIDDNIEDVAESTPKDVDGVPYCKRHHCRMVQYSGGGKENPKAYYKCPVPKCPEDRAQMIKTPRECVVPPKPLTCSRCTNRTGVPVYCERDDHVSTAAAVVLKCPGCGWKSNTLAVPQLAAAHLARLQRPKPEVHEEIGAR